MKLGDILLREEKGNEKYAFIKKEVNRTFANCQFQQTKLPSIQTSIYNKLVITRISNLGKLNQTYMHQRSGSGIIQNTLVFKIKINFKFCLLYP